MRNLTRIAGWTGIYENMISRENRIGGGHIREDSRMETWLGLLAREFQDSS